MSPERGAFIWAMKLTGVTLGILAVLSGAIALGVGGGGSAGAAVAGVAVAAFVGLSTQAVMIEGLRLPPAGLAGLVLGAFVIKAVVLLIILVAVGESDLPREAFVVPLVIGAVATLAIDVMIVWRARVPYVKPSRGNEAG